MPVCAVTILLTLRLCRRWQGHSHPFRFRRLRLGRHFAGAVPARRRASGATELGAAGTFAIFAASIATFVLYARCPVARWAALDLSLFSSRAFSVGVIAGGIGRIGLNSSAFLLPLLLQLGFGMAPIAAAGLASLSAVGAFAAKRCCAGRSSPSAILSPW